MHWVDRMLAFAGIRKYHWSIWSPERVMTELRTQSKLGVELGLVPRCPDSWSRLSILPYLSSLSTRADIFLAPKGAMLFPTM